MSDIFYHGTHAPLFGRFSSDHLREGSGRIRYGFGHYVTEDVGHALHYAAKGATGPSVLLYTVEVPSLAPDNHITYHEPVDPSILARVGAALGVGIPAQVAADTLGVALTFAPANFAGATIGRSVRTVAKDVAADPAAWLASRRALLRESSDAGEARIETVLGLPASAPDAAAVGALVGAFVPRKHRSLRRNEPK